MHQLTCAISFLLHSINLILFTVLLVHLILRISPHHSYHLRSHHLSLPRPFTPDLKLISFTNPFLHSLSGSFWTNFTDLEPHLSRLLFMPNTKTLNSRTKTHQKPVAQLHNWLKNPYTRNRCAAMKMMIC